MSNTPQHLTQPITVYPTETPGVYCTEGALMATRFSIPASGLLWCAGCLQLLNTPSDAHWHIGKRLYCSNCVRVAAEGEGP